jgi:ResB-like family
MELSATSPAKAPRSLLGKIFDIFSGFGLATITLILLGLLTWAATLEQVDNGLYQTLDKYFSTDWKGVFILPEINGKMVPFPLPGGYWLCAILLVNLILGGIIRIRKGWEHYGNLVSHFGIIFLLVGAGVTFHYSERGNMAVEEGGTSNVAEDYLEYVVEVAEIKEGQPTNIQVIRGKDLTDLIDDKSRVFRMPALPFDLEIRGYLKNCVPVSSTERAPDRQQYISDGYFLMEKPKPAKVEQAELFTAGCYAQIVTRDNKKSPPFILARESYYPFSYRLDGRIFTINMIKRRWAMPFTLKLDQFTADFHPGTSMAAKFVSKVTRTENNSEAKFTIQMNEPMRYEGLTFFQASYRTAPGQKMSSVFEIVRNPADQWPKYSLVIVAIGMGITFLIKLFSFLVRGSRKKSHV